jgi:hypothetical protein
VLQLKSPPSHVVAWQQLQPVHWLVRTVCIDQSLQGALAAENMSAPACCSLPQPARQVCPPSVRECGAHELPTTAVARPSMCTTARCDIICASSAVKLQLWPVLTIMHCSIQLARSTPPTTIHPCPHLPLGTLPLPAFQTPSQAAPMPALAMRRHPRRDQRCQVFFLRRLLLLLLLLLVLGSRGARTTVSAQA